MTTTRDIPAARRASLPSADTHSCIEGMRRDPASDPIFEAWVKGDLTESQALVALDALDALDAQRERQVRPADRNH